MVDLTLLQSVSYIAGAIGVCIAAAYYVMNLRISQRNQELTLKALEQSANAQELSLKAQETSVKTQELALKSQQQNLETRQAQLFMQLIDRWTSPEFALSYGKIRYDLCPKFNNSPEEFSQYVTQNTNEKFNPEVMVLVHQLTLFFEGVAVLVKKNLIDMDLVERLFSDRVIWFWRMIKPRIIYAREYQGPQAYTSFEWLYDEMIRRQEKSVAT